MKSMSSTKSVTVRVLTLSLVALLSAAPQVRAQNTIRVSRSLTDSFQPAISTKDVERYSGLLGLDAGQKEAAKSLAESYRAEFEAAAKDMRNKMQAIRQEAQESRDFSAMEQMGPLMEKFSKKSADLEKAVLGDIKTLLNEDQAAAKWPLVERARRRERTIDRGTLAGESVDLVRVVDDLDIKPAAKPELAEAIEQYQVDLDRALIERNRVLDADPTQQKPSSGRLEFNSDDIQKRMKKVREAGSLVRAVNQKYAKTIEPLLGDEERVKFQASIKRQSFPQVYRPSRTTKAFDAAAKFDDLEARQKEALAALKESYERDLAIANEKWTAALVEDEESGNGPIMFGGGAQIMLMMGGDDQTGPVPEARNARRDLDKKVMDALETLLTPAQKEKLPKTEQSPDGMGAIQIMR